MYELLDDLNHTGYEFFVDIYCIGVWGIYPQTIVSYQQSSMDQLEVRINRVIGQLKGIQKMAVEKRDSTQILQQISAVKKAIDSITRELVVADICQSLPDSEARRVKDLVEQAIRI